MGWRGTSLCSHGQLEWLQREGIGEGEAVRSSAPAFHGAEAIPPDVSHMLHICWEPDLHLYLLRLLFLLFLVQNKQLRESL